MATTTWTQTAGMTSDEDVDNVDSFAEQAEASKDAAAASATAAASSESAASASATSASASATTATTKAAEASTSATNAATSASSASSSATSATASETAAAASKNAAAASATAAAASETAAASSETAAAASETAAATSETNAATSATSASTSATTASTAATTASTAATNAATSETNAATSATTASTAATNAATSETNAATSATNAATSETNAATSETNASTSATSASTSASAASTSATAAAASQSAAAASAASAASAYDTFDDRYLGSKTADPTVDNDGDALVAGALYFNSTANEMRVYDGANWIAATSAGNVSLLEYKYTATSGQTIFSGADDSLNTLSYTQDNLIVTLNGVMLENGTDYTATTGTSVVLSSGAAASDELNVIAFKSFTTADMVSSANGGTFYNDIDVQGTVTADGMTSSAVITAQEGRSNTAGTGQIVIDPDDTTVSAAFRLDQTDNKLNIDITNGGTWQKKLSFYAGGDVAFYEDTGTTAKFFWDASAESLGIGTTSPVANTPLTLQGPSGYTDTLWLKSVGTNIDSRINIAPTGTGNAQINNSVGTAIEFQTSGTERMRITSGGSVGIGTTSPFSTSQILNTGWSSGAPYGTVLTVTGNNTNDANWGHLLISDSTTTTGNGGSLRFAVGTTQSDLSPHAGIDGYTEGANYGGLKFLTRPNGGTSTERMRITSTGGVLIGPASAGTTQALYVGTLTNGSASVGFKYSHDDRATLGLQIRTDEAFSSSYPITFSTTGSSDMTLDTSGNLMVGKTAVGYATDGFEARSGGQVAISDTSTVPLLVNINDTGNVHGIMNLYRNGATVGSFKVSYGDLIVGTGDTGIKFYDSSNALFPVNQSTGANRDAEVNLGISSVRFKDLYLSGGVYLGGTGSANKLDDYEEGTWTPKWVNASNQDIFDTAPSVHMARYTKIGDTVIASCYFNNPSSAFGTTAAYGASNGVYVGGLPFTSNRNGSSDFYGGAVGWYDNWNGWTGGTPMCYTNNNGTTITLVYSNGANSSNVQQQYVDNTSSGIILTVSYKTTS